MAVSLTAPARTNRRWKWKGLAIRLATYPLVVYVGLTVALLLREDQLLYNAVRASDYWAVPPQGLVVQDVELRLPDGTAIHAWWCPRPAARMTVLFCHGNGCNLSTYGSAIPRFQEGLNASFLIFDYPGYGHSGGSPSEAGCYAAADAAYEWLVQVQQVPAESILLVGHSLGGGVAVDLACRKPHRALVLLSTFTSIPDMAQRNYPLMPARWLVRNRFDNRAKLGECRAPVFIAHHRGDFLIPYTQAEELFAAADAPKCLFPLEEGNHGHIPDDLFPALRRFLEQSPATSVTSSSIPSSTPRTVAGGPPRRTGS